MKEINGAKYFSVKRCVINLYKNEYYAYVNDSKLPTINNFI